MTKFKYLKEEKEINFKAIVIEKGSRKPRIIEFSEEASDLKYAYRTAQKTLVKNGYQLKRYRLKEAELFDYIMDVISRHVSDETAADACWKYIDRIFRTTEEAYEFAMECLENKGISKNYFNRNKF